MPESTTAGCVVHAHEPSSFYNAIACFTIGRRLWEGATTLNYGSSSRNVSNIPSQVLPDSPRERGFFPTDQLHET